MTAIPNADRYREQMIEAVLFRIQGEIDDIAAETPPHIRQKMKVAPKVKTIFRRQ